MKKVTTSKEYWDKVAGTVTFTIPLKDELIRHYFPPNARILDYGCGYGRTLQSLWELGFRNLLGVDFSPAMITKGRSMYPHLELQIGNASGLPRDLPQFDVILLIAVLTAIPDDNEQQTLIKNLDHLLRPGGLLYACDFLLGDDERNLERYAKFQPKYGTYGVFELEEGVVVRHYDPTRVQKLFSAFKQREFGVELYTTMLGHPAKGFYYLGQKHGKIPIGRS